MFAGDLALGLVIGGVVGLFLGASVGAFLVSLCVAASQADAHLEREETP